MAEGWRPWISGREADRDASARNLLQYLALRGHDLRDLQDPLIALGLSGQSAARRRRRVPAARPPPARMHPRRQAWHFASRFRCRGGLRRGRTRATPGRRRRRSIGLPRALAQARVRLGAHLPPAARLARLRARAQRPAAQTTDLGPYATARARRPGVTTLRPCQSTFRGLAIDARSNYPHDRTYGPNNHVIGISPDLVAEFEREWIEAWNAHDLDRILSHYRDDIRFVSPFAARYGAPHGRVDGLHALRAYFERGLATYPALHFQPIAVLAGVGSIALHYRSVEDRQAIEVMQLDARGQVRHAAAPTYGPPPGNAAR